METSCGLGEEVNLDADIICWQILAKIRTAVMGRVEWDYCIEIIYEVSVVCERIFGMFVKCISIAVQEEGPSFGE